MSFTTCCNTHCGKTFIPTEQAIWIANTYTACSPGCKAQFLTDNAPLVERHLRLLGVDIPTARDTLLKLAAMVL